MISILSSSVKKNKGKFITGLRYISLNYELYLFVLPALIYIVVYCYAPMYGVQIAFKDYRINKGIHGSDWVGLKHFIRFLTTPSCIRLIKNTLVISVYSLVVGFPFPIIFALIVNELRDGRFKKAVQTISYAPHFISTVVMVSIITMFLHESTGIVNKLIGYFGIGPYAFMSKARWFPSIYVFSGIWQNMGWNAIIYIASLSTIDSELHEAAMIDGASRLQRIYHINLYGILPTITIMLILATGRIMTVGSEKVLLMQNPLNTEVSEVIATFVYKMGLQHTQYSFSTSINLFNSIINFILLISVNSLVKRIGSASLW
jgi:putative aldouronate transport system permease protein